MAKGRSDDCVKVGGRSTGVWVTLEPLLTTRGGSTK